MVNAKKAKRSSPTLSNGVRTLGRSSDTIATVGVGIDSMIARGDSRRDYSHMLDCHMKTKNALVSILILCAVLPVLLIPMSAKAGPIPDTGQTKCYNDSEEIKCPRPGEPFYGQDGNYTFNPPSYTKLDEARNDLADDATEWVMVRDNVTGLIWEVKTDDASIHDKYDAYTWCDNNPDTNGGNAGTCGDGTDTEDFINALNTANFGGFSDWHLPNVRDLISLANLNRYAPAIDTNYFPNRAWDMLTYGYWSSTTSAAHNHTAWHMDFEIGFAGDNVKSNSNYVRAVRGGQPARSHHFVDNGNGTVTDTDTGLMWQQETAPDGMNWQNALSYCEDLILGGYDDWRLPNVVELISLADPNGFYPAINTNYFPAPGIHYSNWSSTTWAYRIDEARDVGFNSGKAGSGGKSANMYVRAVRGRQSRSLEFGDLLVSGIPTTPTNQTGAFISVGGSNIVSYKYKLDEGSYGVETPVATVIVLSSLSHGSHTLDVIGKDADGIWQSEQDAPSIAWAVDTTPPNADAGSDSTMGENTTVTLSGLNSSDPDSGIAFYYWEQTAGTSISLSDTTVSQPTFVTPDVSSDGESLSFQLTVTNNAGSKSTATRIVNISWSNVAPVSNAGSDQAVEEGDTVTLNGLDSSDEDDGISTYQWAQTAGTAVTISDKAAAHLYSS